MSTLRVWEAYKKDNEICPVEDDWVIIKTSYCTRQKDGLKRYTTYFNTQNTQYLWINNIAVCEYIGKDSDEHSNLDPHMHSKYNDEPYRAQDKAAMSEALKMKEQNPELSSSTIMTFVMLFKMP